MEKSGIMQYLNIWECEFTENVSKENYACTILAVLINLYVNSQLNGFHELIVFTIIVFMILNST